MTAKPRDDKAKEPAGHSHYFDNDPNLESRRNTVTVALADTAFELVTDRGVFSPKRLDPGTKVLLSKGARFDPEAAPIVADIGTGYGPIACTVARRCRSAQIWAIDINKRAIELCSLNAERLGLANIEALHSDDVDENLRFDRIVSNPPIRIGKARLHELLTHWLNKLKPDGYAELVVQKHLGSDSLQRWLISQGWPTERVLSYQSYRILKVLPASKDLAEDL